MHMWAITGGAHAWTHNHDVVRLYCSSIFSAFSWTSLIKLHLKTRSCFNWRQKMDTVYQSLNVAYVLLTMIPDKVESILRLLPELWFTVTGKKKTKNKLQLCRWPPQIRTAEGLNHRVYYDFYGVHSKWTPEHEQAWKERNPARTLSEFLFPCTAASSKLTKIPWNPSPS